MDWTSIAGGTAGLGGVWVMVKKYGPKVAETLVQKWDKHNATVCCEQSFSKYCEASSKMIESNDGIVLAVQTPHFVKGREGSKFQKYLDDTVKHIVGCGKGKKIDEYSRLIVIDKDSVDMKLIKLSNLLIFFSSKRKLKREIVSMKYDSVSCISNMQQCGTLRGQVRVSDIPSQNRLLENFGVNSTN